MGCSGAARSPERPSQGRKQKFPAELVVASQLWLGFSRLWLRGSRLRLDELSSTFATAGRNTGHIHTGGEHDCDGSRFSFDALSASDPLDGRGLGKPDGNGGRVAWWMLRLENIRANGRP